MSPSSTICLDLALLGDGVLRPGGGGGRGQEGAQTESGDRETNTERQTGEPLTGIN